MANYPGNLPFGDRMSSDPSPVTAGATLTVRIPGVPFPLAFGDWVHDRLYHTIQFTSGDTEALSIFVGTNGPIPGGTRTMTRIDTNLPRSGESGLPLGYEGLIYSLQLELARAAQAPGAEPTLASASFPGDVPTLFELQRKLFFQFRYNNKSVSEGRMGKYPQGGGLHVVTQVSGQEVAQNAAIDPRGALSFVLPLWLRPDIGYAATLTPVVALVIAQAVVVGGVAGTCTHVDIQASLEGLIKRPVV